MKIGVLSDTHGDAQGVQQALAALEKLGVSLLIHCGDVGLEIIPLLRGLTTHFVHGNMDDVNQLRQAIIGPEHTFHDPLGELEIEGRRVAFLHGHDVKLLRHTIHSGHWDLVCHGHTHAFSRSMEGTTLVLNPGALARTSHPSLAVVDLPSLEVTQIPLGQTTA
jgi:uncharacterized protein